MVIACLMSAVGILPEYLIGRQRLWSEGMMWATHHHNDFAACMLLLLPVLLFRTISERRSAWLPVLAVILIGFVLSGSRGYYLAFPFVIIGFLVTGVRDVKAKYTIGVVLLVVFVILAVAVPGIRTRFEWMLSVDASIVTRLNLLRVVGWVLSENPLVGIGPGQLAEHGEYLVRLKDMGLVVDVGRSVIEHLHNVYATVAVENGLIGLGLFSWMLVATGRKLFSGDRIARALFWGYVGLLIGNLFDTQLMGPSAGIDFFFLAGLFAGVEGTGPGYDGS
jgi:O-antigen ligase